MHSITLNTAAGVLLLSSIVSLSLLIKRSWKSGVASSISILSLSDIISSILTASVVLLHKFYTTDGNSLNISSDDKRISEYIITTMVGRIFHGKISTNYTEYTVDRECDFKSLYLQYAMFLIPFASTFMSLISFSSSFYAKTKQICWRCTKWSKIQKQISKPDDNKVEIAIETAQKGTGKKNETKMQKIIVKNKRFVNSNGKYSGFALTVSQWIIPAIFSGFFRLGEHQKIDFLNQTSENLICTIAANFPFENCIADSHFFNQTSSIALIGSSESIQNYVGDEDNLMWPNPNSTEVQAIMSKVHDIVQSVWNNSENSNEITPTRGYYNFTQLLGIVNNEEIYENITAMENKKLVHENEVKFKSRLLRRIMKENLNFMTNEVESADVQLIAGMKQEVDDIHLLTPVFIKAKEVMSNNEQFQKCTKNRCIISIQFLKLHLFAILIFLYFAPIFISTVLLIISYYKCQEIVGKLEDENLKTNSIIQDTEELARLPGSTAPTSGWFPSSLHEEIVQVDLHDSQQKIGDKQEDYSLKFEETACKLLRETEKMKDFCQILKINAIAAVALWTPFFTQVLSKVFFCSDIPNWVMETTFLATIVFAVFRNAANINIVKVETEDLIKLQNTIHPN